jgi:hypothetical protein
MALNLYFESHEFELSREVRFHSDGEHIGRFGGGDHGHSPRKKSHFLQGLMQSLVSRELRIHSRDFDELIQMTSWSGMVRCGQQITVSDLYNCVGFPIVFSDLPARERRGGFGDREVSMAKMWSAQGTPAACH